MPLYPSQARCTKKGEWGWDAEAGESLRIPDQPGLYGRLVFQKEKIIQDSFPLSCCEFSNNWR